MEELLGEEGAEEDDMLYMCEPRYCSRQSSYIETRSSSQDSAIEKQHGHSTIQSEGKKDQTRCVRLPHPQSSSNLTNPCGVRQGIKNNNLKLVRVKRKCQKQASSSILQAAYFVNYCKAQAKKYAKVPSRMLASNPLLPTWICGAADHEQAEDAMDEGRKQRSRRRGSASSEENVPCFSKLYSNDSSGPASSWEATASSSSDSPI